MNSGIQTTFLVLFLTTKQFYFNYTEYYNIVCKYTLNSDKFTLIHEWAIRILYSPSLLHLWRRIEAVVIAVREILGTVGVTSTLSTFWPSCEESGASNGNEFFMALAT